MRTGVRLGVDVGTVRVGVAASDPAATLATPVATLKRRRDGSDLAELARLAAEREAVEIVVGLPTGLSGRAGPAARSVTTYAKALAGLVAPIVVRLVDERFTTAGAARNLRASGRDTRAGRAVIDQAAAVIILQSALDEERATGASPGSLVRGGEGELPRTADGMVATTVGGDVTGTAGSEVAGAAGTDTKAQSRARQTGGAA